MTTQAPKKIVLTHGIDVLCELSAPETFPGEIDAARDLLAHERGITPTESKVWYDR